MNGWIAAFRDIEAHISGRKGEFALFGLFLPTEGADQWDLVVSAPWARRDDRAALDVVSDEIAGALSGLDTLRLARIVVIETWHPDVQEINSRFDVEHDLISLTNEEHFGYVAERALIITSKDYWRFIKRLFPANAQFVFFTRDGDLRIRIYWPLGDDPRRPHKQSKNIILAISEEALGYWLHVDDPRRREAELKLAAFVADKLKGFDPHHDAPEGVTPPRERWSVDTALFRRPKLAAG